ncbi:unnamed protein product [Fraxinus pennsylvanica]|uniref:Uncharacterized protein n=1 Tax=Fraxinus pennsylvanica TaxID=56036 RepID=A0AAD2DNM7_9LAMI|nr:unnamed protein product [Fraxinus pennsylvanica]
MLLHVHRHTILHPIPSNMNIPTTTKSRIQKTTTPFPKSSNLNSTLFTISELHSPKRACNSGIYSLSNSSVLLSDIWKPPVDPSWITRTMSLINRRLILQVLAVGKRFYCRPSTGNLINMIGG